MSTLGALSRNRIDCPTSESGPLPRKLPVNKFIPRFASRLGPFALVALLAAGAVAKPTSSPFKATLTLTETVLFTGAAPCFAIGSLQAVGTASLLGKVTATSSDCINPQGVTDPNSPSSFNFASTGTGSAGLVFTAANGDLLFVTYSGTLTAQPAGPHQIAGHFVITGGTGRFLGATGGGSLSGYEDISQVVSGHGTDRGGRNDRLLDRRSLFGSRLPVTQGPANDGCHRSDNAVRRSGRSGQREPERLERRCQRGDRNRLGQHRDSGWNLGRQIGCDVSRDDDADEERVGRSSSQHHIDA